MDLNRVSQKNIDQEAFNALLDQALAKNLTEDVAQLPSAASNLSNAASAASFVSALRTNPSVEDQVLHNEERFSTPRSADVDDIACETTAPEETAPTPEETAPEECGTAPAPVVETVTPRRNPRRGKRPAAHRPKGTAAIKKALDSKKPKPITQRSRKEDPSVID